MKRQRLLMASALAALALAASACSKKGDFKSGGGSTPQQQPPPDPPTPPRPVTGYCYGIHGCTAGPAVETTEEACAQQGGRYVPKS